MKKKVVILLTLVALLALAIPTFAETITTPSSEQTTKINNLHKQIIELRMQMVDEMEKVGEINSEQAKFMKDNMQQRMEYLQQNPDAVGPMKNGRGFCDGTGGKGFAKGWRGCNNNQQTLPNAQ